MFRDCTIQQIALSSRNDHKYADLQIIIAKMNDFLNLQSLFAHVLKYISLLLYTSDLSKPISILHNNFVKKKNNPNALCNDDHHRIYAPIHCFVIFYRSCFHKLR